VHGPAPEKEWAVLMRKWVLGAAMLAMVASMTGGVRGQGGTPAQILVVLNDSAPNPFGHYLPEILRAEGINTFDVVQLSALDAPTLGAATLVVLAETPLTAPEATLFIDYVTAGGRLVAMRPDAQLHAALGIAAAAGTTANGYALLDQSGPGAGLQNVTLPFKGVADHYDLAGATAVAELYSTRTTSASRAAVVRHGGTAAWAFDLARSTAYTRQGEPTLAGIDRDNLPGPPMVRTNDVFYQTIDLERVPVPHADVQQRFFARVIAELLADATPLPRLWYFPGASRTLLIPTGDSHTSTPAKYTPLIAAIENVGAHITLYLSRSLDLSGSPVATWLANGHEIGMHPYFAPLNEGNFVFGYDEAVTWFQSVPLTPSATGRHHGLEWGGWVDPVSVMASHGVRMDLTYYAWGPALDNPTLANQAHGYITGSGLPMRFISATGQVSTVYQQVTALADEQLLDVDGPYSQDLSTADALEVSRQLIDDSQAGGYSAIATQFHVDYYDYGHVQPWVDGTLAYAAGQQIPMWTAERWLNYTEHRAATAVSDITWTPGTGVLSFSVAVPAGAEAQTVTLPTTFAGRTLNHLTLDGITVAPTLLAINGQPTQLFSVAPLGGGGARTVVASYALPASLPTIAVNDVPVVETDAGTTLAGLTVTLSAAAATDVTVVWATSDGTATAGADYVAGGGTLTFSPGVTSLPLSITVNGDVVSEPHETVLVTLSNPVGATFGDANGVVTILDDEPDPTDWTHTTAADFSTCSTVSGTRVGAAGDVRLLGTFRDDFAAGSLDPRWISGSWAEPPTPYTPAPSGGVLSLGNADGAYIRSTSEVTGTTIEVRARFNASPYQVIGLADDTFTSRYARFSTESLGTNLFAATDPGSGAMLTDLGPIPVGYHVFTIERIAQGATELIRYRIDGAVVADHTVTTGDLPAARYLFLSEAGGATPTLDVDAVEVDPPVASPGSFDSCTIDALLSVVWNQLSWTATTPAGSSVQVRTRSSLDNVTWSAWSAPLTTSGTSITSPNGRYLQYRLELATADPAAAPVVHDVSVTAIGPAPPTIFIGNAAVVEGPAASAVFTATLSSASLQTVSAAYATAGVTATSGADFTPAAGTVTFLPGETVQTVAVAVSNDALDEDDETFTVTLSAPVNGTIGTAVGTGTITDDDAPPVVSIAGVSVVEGDAGTTAAAFPVSLSAPSGKTVTVTFASADGTATAGADYAAAGGTVTFTPGVVLQNATVNVTGDIVAEPAETYTVTLSAPGNATLGTAAATGTITDDDVLPTAVADSYATPFNTPLVVAAPGVLANDTNDGGGAMTAQLATDVSHGTLALTAGGGFTYTPTTGYTGGDSFSYQVVDGSGTSAPATVTLSVGLEPPTPAADAYTTPFETTLSIDAPGVLGNDDAHTAPGLTAVLVSGVAHGTLTLGADGAVLYTPDAGFAGADSFVYRADSAAGTGGTASVTITVAEPTVVQVPQELRVAAMSGNVVTLRWKAPAIGPDPTGFVVEGGVVPGQTLAALPTGLAAPIFTFTAPSGSFYVRVRSLGAGGPSAASNEILMHVAVPVPPSAPTALTATVNGDVLHLGWQPTFGGGAATTVFLDVTGSITASLPLPAGERMSFAGVPSGTYTLAVRGTNAGGSGPAAAPLSVTVPGVCAGPPAAPTNLLAYTAGGTTFLIWDPPASGEAPVGYVVSVPGIGSLPLSTQTISGPLPAGSYTIGVHAVGACGMSTAATQPLTVP